MVLSFTNATSKIYKIMATERKPHKMVITLENVLPADAISIAKS